MREIVDRGVTQDNQVITLDDGYLVTPKNPDDADTQWAETIGIPEMGVLESVVENVAMQLFAFHVANVKDRYIDKRRNLANSAAVQ